MRTCNFILVVTFFVFALQASGATSNGRLPYFEADDLTPVFLSDATAKENKKHQLAVLKSLTVLDQDGRQVTEKSIGSSLALVNFFFADCPGLCPTMMKSIQSFWKKLGPESKDVKIYSFSVQPKRDTPLVLKKYAKKMSINLSYWSLLTGSEKEIFHIGKDMLHADGSVGAQKSDDTFIHTRNIYLIDRGLHVRGIYDTGDNTAMANLVNDLKTLTSEGDVFE